MQKITALALALALVTPTATFAASVKVTSPEGGETFTFGQTIDISWKPTSKGIATIEMASSRKDGSVLGLYGAKVFGDPVNRSGHFSYELPNYLVVPAGEYRIRLYPEGSSKAIESRTFTLSSGDDSPAEKTVKAKYKIGKFLDLEKRYSAGAPIHFEVQGYEKKKVPATAAHNFNVQAHLYLASDMTSALSAVNATYDAGAGVWAVDMTAPEKSGKYVVRASLYCGYVGLDSYCAQKYDSYQAEKKVKFSVR